MSYPKAVFFDLDDTLAESFHAPSDEMIQRLERLLSKSPLAIISAATFERIDRDILARLSPSLDCSSFYIFSNSASQCFTWSNNEWTPEYELGLSENDRSTIIHAIEEAVLEANIPVEHPEYQAQILDRGVQIAYVALGTAAPYEIKASWDPDQKKRKKLITILEQHIPQYEIMMGGMTTIDVTHKGVDKAYGVRWLAQKLGIQPQEMLYVGDALYEGGNDAAVIPTGIPTHMVSGPQDTASFIDAHLLS